MITVRHSVETLFFVAISTALILFVMMQRSNHGGLPVFSALPPIAVALPTPTDAPNKVQSTSMDSPEGSKTLTLESLDNKGTTSYSLFVSAKSDSQRQQIFKKDEPSGQSLEIPFNTWSSDNAYVFLKEKTSGDENYFVFQSSGNLFPNETAYLSVQELFNKKVQNFVIEEATGWAGPNLLVVNTRSIDGSKKVSFWFDVSSQSFIQLGTYFK